MDADDAVDADIALEPSDDDENIEKQAKSRKTVTEVGKLVLVLCLVIAVVVQVAFAITSKLLLMSSMKGGNMITTVSSVLFLQGGNMYLINMYRTVPLRANSASGCWMPKPNEAGRKTTGVFGCMMWKAAQGGLMLYNAVRTPKLVN